MWKLRTSAQGGAEGGLRVINFAAPSAGGKAFARAGVARPPFLRTAAGSAPELRGANLDDTGVAAKQR